MYHQDWLIRQIRYTIQFIAMLLFKRNTAVYEVRDIDRLTQTDELYLRMRTLLGERRINEAENLLFERLDEADLDYLRIALDFYAKVNDLSDAELEAADFSRDEVESGLDDFKRIYGIFF